jgi:hypothetical protein
MTIRRMDYLGKNERKTMNPKPRVRKAGKQPKGIKPTKEELPPRRAKSQVVYIPPPRVAWMEVVIVGTTPLIMNKWSEKAKTILGGREKGDPIRKEKRKPEEEFEAATHMYKGDYVFPVAAFKKAMVHACTFIDKKFTKIFARGAFFIRGDVTPDLVKLECTEPWMREDTVRRPPKTGSASLAYRPQFDEWKCSLKIRFLEDIVTREQILHLLSYAGFCVGIGEMRPSSESGTEFGCFEVEGAEAA